MTTAISTTADSLYKVTNENGTCIYGVGSWPLPTEDKPGKWLSAKGELLPCENGLHLCREQHLVEWLGPEIYEAEYDGRLVEADNKVVVRKARLLRRVGGWNEQTARLFAADCAERTLKIVNDGHCIAAVLAARQYAFGLIDDAARDAARAAAWAAARAAARDAARAAAWDAAWAAARAAAWDAARAAARAAAWAAARAAARDAARAAEQEWQTTRLLEYLTGKVDLDAIRAQVSP